MDGCTSFKSVLGRSCSGEWYYTWGDGPSSDHLLLASVIIITIITISMIGIIIFNIDGRRA